MADGPRIERIGQNEVTISGIDTEKFNGVMAGCRWFTVDGGQAQFVERFSELPAAKDDEQILPFWSGGSRYKRLADFDHEFGFQIHISHLCGYGYTPERYEQEAQRLTRYGFECLRSRRGPDGKYWEVWILFGLFAAKGDLKEFIDSDEKLSGSCIDKKTRKYVLEAVISWLCSHCSFGTLDVANQARAMVID